MKKTFDAVIFDMDGLMLDTETIYRSALQIAAHEMGYHIDEALFARFIGVKGDVCERMLAAAMGPKFPLAAFRQCWLAKWDRQVNEQGIAVKPGLAALLDQLDQTAIPKAVATSTERKKAIFCLQHAGIGTRFVSITSGDQVVNGKPAPDIYLLAAQKLGVDPARCLALEDSEAGVMSAVRAGMCTVMVPDLKQPSQEVRALAYRVLPSLHEVVSLLVS